MIAPVDGSGSWPACRQIVLNRACVVSFTIPLRYMLLISRSPRPWPTADASADRRPPTRRAARAVRHAARARDRRRRRRAARRLRRRSALGAVAGVRRASSTRSRRSGASRSAPPTSSCRLIVAGEAPPAVARPPQADPLVHLHRLHSGDPDRRVLPARAASCCSTTSARTWCRAELRGAGRSGAVRRAEHRARDPARGRPRRRRHPRTPAGKRDGRVRRRVAGRRAGRPSVRRRSATAGDRGASCDVVDRRPVGARRRRRRRFPTWIDCGGFDRRARRARRPIAGDADEVTDATSLVRAVGVSRRAATRLRRRSSTCRWTTRSRSGCGARPASRSRASASSLRRRREPVPPSSSRSPAAATPARRRRAGSGGILGNLSSFLEYRDWSTGRVGHAARVDRS